MTAWAFVLFRSSLKTAQVIMRPAYPMIHRDSLSGLWQEQN